MKYIANFNKFSKPLKFIKNNKRNLAIGAGVTGVGALGYGGYKLHQNKDRIVRDVGFRMIKPTVESASREFAKEFFQTPQMKTYIAKKQNQFDNLIGQGNNKFNNTVNLGKQKLKTVSNKTQSKIDEGNSYIKELL